MRPRRMSHDQTPLKRGSNKTRQILYVDSILTNDMLTQDQRISEPTEPVKQQNTHKHQPQSSDAPSSSPQSSPSPHQLTH